MADYVHGYSECEAMRLSDQANTLSEILHHDTIFPDGSRVLEAGCGVGAQTVIIAQQNPEVEFVSIDMSADSIEQAINSVREHSLENVSLQVADIYDLPFEPESFDHIFVCFVLEHLPDPVGALECVRKVLKPGGALTAIEGDHGSCYFHPDSAYAKRAVQCLIDEQARIGGDSLIGRRLYPLLNDAGFRCVKVSPRMVYVDDSRPELIDGFTKKTFTAMVEGVREAVIERNLMNIADFDRGVADLYRTAEPGGTFCYTFFKAIAVKR